MVVGKSNKMQGYINYRMRIILQVLKKFYLTGNCTVFLYGCCGFGSGIRCLFDPSIRYKHPGPAKLTGTFVIISYLDPHSLNLLSPLSRSGVTLPGGLKE
jgi:hypothetical protein